MLAEPAPRASQGLSSKAERSGTKLVSHRMRPGRIEVISPSPANQLGSASRSVKVSSFAKMKGTLWNRFRIMVRLLVEARRAGAMPDPLKIWCRAFSGMANMLFGPHSKLWVCPSAVSTLVEPWPDST